MKFILSLMFSAWHLFLKDRLYFFKIMLLVFSDVSPIWKVILHTQNITQPWPVSLKKTTWTTVHRRSWRFVSFNVLRHCLKYTVTVVFTCIQFFLLWQWLFHAKVAKHVVLPLRGVNLQFFLDLTQLIRFGCFFFMAWVTAVLRALLEISWVGCCCSKTLSPTPSI